MEFWNFSSVQVPQHYYLNQEWGLMSDPQDTIDTSYEGLIALSERIGQVKKGLSVPQMQHFPTQTVLGNCQKESCSICLSELELGELKKGLTCFHWFHASCIDEWLKLHHICPL